MMEGDQDYGSCKLMSVDKTADDGTISIFIKDGVTVHKEHNVLITCRGEPFLIGSETNMDVIAVLSNNTTKVIGNHVHPRSALPRSFRKPTACMTFRQPSRPSNKCTQCVVTPSNQLGSRQLTAFQVWSQIWDHSSIHSQVFVHISVNIWS
jgi:hypothetical protein